jgi:hypothetical protein
MGNWEMETGLSGESERNHVRWQHDRVSKAKRRVESK